MRISQASIRETLIITALAQGQNLVQSRLIFVLHGCVTDSSLYLSFCCNPLKLVFSLGYQIDRRLLTPLGQTTPLVGCRMTIRDGKLENWQGHMAVTLPIVLAAVSDFGATTPLALKIGQTRPLFLAILKSRKPLVRPALPDAVNRAEGSFMTPALYPAPRSQGDEVCTLCRKLAAEAEGESRPQRLTAGQTAPGYPSPSPGVKAAHRAKNIRKGESSAPSFQRVEVGAVTR